MSRRAAWGLGTAIGLGALALVLAVTFRIPLLESALLWALREQGVPGASVPVRAFSLHEIRLANVRLEYGGTLSARDVRLVYSPASLFAGRLEEIDIDGLSLDIDLRGGPARFLVPPSRLEDSTRIPSGAAPVPVFLPPLTITDGRILARTPTGDLRGRFEGAATPDGQGNFSALATFEAAGPPGHLSGTMEGLVIADGSMNATLSIEQGSIASQNWHLRDMSGRLSVSRTSAGTLEGQGQMTAAAARGGGELGVSRLTMTLTEDRAEARLALDDGAVLEARITSLRTRPNLAFSARVTAKPANPVWHLAALPQPASGRLDALLEGEARLAPLAQWVDWREVTPAAFFARLPDGFSARWEIALEDLTYPGMFQGLTGAAQGRARIDGTAGRLWLDEPSQFKAGQPIQKILPSLGTPPWMSDLLAHEGSFSLNGSASGAPLVEVDWVRSQTAVAGEVIATAQSGKGQKLAEIAIRGRALGSLSQGTGEAEVNATLAHPWMGEVAAKRIALHLPVELAWRGGEISGRTSGRGDIEIAGFSYGSGLSAKTPLAATIGAAEALYGSGSLEYTAHLLPAPMTLAFYRADSKPRTLTITAAEATVTGKAETAGQHSETLKLANVSVEVPEAQLALDDTLATLAFGAPPPKKLLVLERATVKSLSSPPFIVPVEVSGQAHRKGEALIFAFDAMASKSAAHAIVRGKYAPRAGTGDLEAEAGPLSFAPGILQPVALSPALGALKSVTGRMQARARLTWSPDGLAGTASASLADMSLETPEATIQNLNVSLVLDSLFPLTSTPGQHLSARRIDPGVPLEDIEVTYRIDSAPGPRLVIAEGWLTLGGGRIGLRETALDPALPRQNLPLEVHGLDLAEALKLLNVSGLSGDGRLSGSLPILADDTGLEIENGHLAAEGPGRIRFDSEAASRVLAGAGESAELMLRALQDFRYDEFNLSVSVVRAGTARLGLTMLGHNPAVLDGYPFRFNINLETNPVRLMRALRDAYRVSNRALRRLWIPGP